jgi:nudix-type nucleoside diphosphatase (YffH/AdpP family)
MYKIVKEKMILDDGFKVEEATIAGENKDTFRKLRLKREDAAAVLLLNTSTQKYVLTKQFRYPASIEKEQLLEIAAGKIEQDDDPISTAIRETEEETGYKIKEGNLRFLLSCYASPGYSTECFHIYFATVTDADKISKGGGLESEHEHIEVVEIEKSEFEKMIRERKIKDAKTYLAGLVVQNEK